MIKGRHNTHTLSSSLSSSIISSHSYDLDKKVKNKRKSLEDKDNKLTKFEINKINDILIKYNLISTERNEKEDEIKNYKKRKSVSKPRKSNFTFSLNTETQKKKKKKNSKIKNDINNNIQSNNNKKEKEKENNISENNKKKDVIYAISYKKLNRETRFYNNMIQNGIEEGNKIKKKLENNNNNKLLIYQQMNDSRNLLRSINKPEISFITKLTKKIGTYYNNYDLFSLGIRLNVRNNNCFYTKKIVRQDEFIVIEKQMKIKKFEKLKKEVEEEKIPTFSSINTSSSNSSKKLKAKRKPKTKSKTKKKTGKYQNKIKPKNISTKKKKTTILPKYKKLRSISMNSKISNEKSEDRKTVTSRMNAFTKIPNIKKKNNNIKFERRPIDIKNRKYSVLSRLPNTLFNKNKLGIKNKINSTNSLRIMKNFNSPFKNNLLKINKITEHENNKDNNSAIRDKDKQNNEIDFKKFLEEQKKKRSNQIRNFMKKQGMNSYNFFYPKEPSPLLGIFKNKCSVYPTLNMNRKSLIEEKEEENKYKLNDINNKNNLILIKGNKSYRNEYKKNENDEDIIKMHKKGKHYGNENDCPICRTFKLKKEEDNNSMNYYTKTSKFSKLKYIDKSTGIFTPNSQTSLNNIIEFPLLSRNRTNSDKKNDKNESFYINKNFNVLFEYFMQ